MNQDKQNIDIDPIVAHSAILMSQEVSAKIIAVLTKGGKLAELVTQANPYAQVLAFTDDEAVAKIMSEQGILATVIIQPINVAGAIEQVRQYLLQNDLAIKGDKIILTYGRPEYVEEDLAYLSAIITV